MSTIKIKTVEVMQPHTEDKVRIGPLRVFVWPAGETVLEQLITRHTRPVELFRTILVDAMKLAAPKLSITPEYAEEVALKAKWSTRAGCSCPCSPGFIISGVYTKSSVHVTIEANTPDNVCTE